ncbi:NYN domain-containing protein [Egbenema bharatensis]|uniref:NYN domain-containing protein n=1 Tax=Egbenema bharatensis TaxID=3463334 RepID=UPI003A878E35
MTVSDSYPDTSSAIISQIVLEIYRVAVQVKQQAPEHLAEKYRHLQWESPQIKANFIRAFSSKFSQSFHQSTLKAKIEPFLRELFLPGFFDSQLFVQLNQAIDQLIGEAMPSASPIEPDPDPAPEPALSQPLPSPVSEPTIGIAILLLDVENLRLPPDAEKFLNTVCTYPIQIKIAIANWRAIGKLDLDMHQRGYQMIHVPAGANSADMKITAIGSSIFVHYPNVREVIICSSDGDLSHLCHTLSTHGLTVYSARKQSEALLVKNWMTGKLDSYSFQPPVVAPSLSETIACLKQLIQEEQNQTHQQWVKLSRLSTLFRQKSGLPISHVLGQHKLAGKVKDFLAEYPTDFVVHQPPGQTEWYVTAFQLEVEPEATQGVSAPSNSQSPDNFASPAQSDLDFLPAEVETKQQLERVLVTITTQLLSKSSDDRINLSALASEFSRQYVPITKAMKTLDIRGSFLAFASTIEVLKIQQEGQSHYVSIRSDKQVD